MICLARFDFTWVRLCLGSHLETECHVPPVLVLCSPARFGHKAVQRFKMMISTLLKALYKSNVYINFLVQIQLIQKPLPPKSAYRCDIPSAAFMWIFLCLRTIIISDILKIIYFNIILIINHCFVRRSFACCYRPTENFTSGCQIQSF